jgi:hypothetical protein
MDVICKHANTFDHYSLYSMATACFQLPGGIL